MANKILVLAFLAIIAIVAIAVANMSYATVDSGEIGVLRTFGETSMEPQQEGFHWILPIAQTITPMSIQIQKYESATPSASKDLQSVRTEITVNYHPDPSMVPVVFQQLGVNYEDRIINPAIEETVKQVTANFNAEELITQRPLVKAEIENAIKTRLAINNIIVDHVSITDFRFSDKFDKVIEEKVEAEQKAFKAENDLLRIEIEAKQAIAKAYGIAESKKAIGDAEAYALTVVGEALRSNSDLLTKEYINNWNGVLPYFYSSGGEGNTPQLLLSVESTRSP